MTPWSVIEWALERGNLLENLKEAIMGNYRCIISLTSVLDSGVYSKKLLDEIIDRCKYITIVRLAVRLGTDTLALADAVVNLREDILTNRIRQTTQTSSDNNTFLAKALAGLQRYFFLLCFASYINESPDTNFQTRFSSWVRARSEIWTMLEHLRRKGPQLYLFRPVDDLHQGGGNDLTTRGRPGPFGYGHSMFEMIGAGSQNGIVAGEMEEFILKVQCAVIYLANSNI